MPNTTVNALPYPAYGTGADGPAAFQALAEAVAPKLHRAEPLTTAQIAAITSPRIGQFVFNTDLGRSQEWNGTLWRAIGTGASGQLSLTTTATGVDTQYSFFVGTGFSEVEWFASVVGSIYGFGALSVANASSAILRTNYNASGVSGAIFVSAVDGTNSFGSRVPSPQSNATSNMYNSYYAPSSGLVFFNLAPPQAVTQRINWRAR